MSAVRAQTTRLPRTMKAIANPGCSVDLTGTNLIVGAQSGFVNSLSASAASFLDPLDERLHKPWIDQKKPDDHRQESARPPIMRAGWRTPSIAMVLRSQFLDRFQAIWRGSSYEK